jgi:hypothetical protein
MSINDQYQNIIKRCKFIAKEDTWYVEGSEVNFDYNYIEYKENYIFGQGFSLFAGWTNETYEGYIGDLPRYDSETCDFSEFLIYDEYGNEISELTLNDYISLLRDQKINIILND